MCYLHALVACVDTEEVDCITKNFVLSFQSASSRRTPAPSVARDEVGFIHMVSLRRRAVARRSSAQQRAWAARRTDLASSGLTPEPSTRPRGTLDHVSPQRRPNGFAGVSPYAR